MTSIDLNMLELMNQVRDPLSEFNCQRRAYGSAFIMATFDAATGESGFRIVKPEDVMIRDSSQGTRTVSPTRLMTSTMPSYQELPKVRTVDQQLMVDTELERAAAMRELLRGDEDWTRSYREYSIPVPDWPELRRHRGHELTWECRGAELLEQRERDVLRRRHEARSRQSYACRPIGRRTMKRTRSPRGNPGFQS